MRAGCPILRVNFDDCAISITGVPFVDHPAEALAYGIAWSSDAESLGCGANGALVGSCSFYDASFRIWRTQA
jgi:hypothetical protein